VVTVGVRKRFHISSNQEEARREKNIGGSRVTPLAFELLPYHMKIRRLI
jgi:hypothetical protein